MNDEDKLKAAEKAMDEGRIQDFRKILAPLVERQLPAAIRMNASYFEAGTPVEEADRLFVAGMFRSAELGDLKAKYQVGVFYDLGEYDIPVDKQKASEIFKELAELGNAHCLWIYSCELLWGKGSFPQDIAKGLEILDKAIQCGSPEACITKAGFFHEGNFGFAIDLSKRDKFRELAKNLEGNGYVYDPYSVVG